MPHAVRAVAHSLRWTAHSLGVRPQRVATPAKGGGSHCQHAATAAPCDCSLHDVTAAPLSCCPWQAWGL